MSNQHIAAVKIDVSAARESEIELAVNTFLAAGYRLENVVSAGPVVAFLFLGDEAARSNMVSIRSQTQDGQMMQATVQTQPRHSGQAPGAGPSFAQPGPSEVDQMLAQGRAHVGADGRLVMGPFQG